MGNATMGLLVVVGLALFAIGFVMNRRINAKRSRSQRMADFFVDYDARMNRFRNR